MSLYPTLTCETSCHENHKPFLVLDPAGQLEAYKVYANDTAEAQQVYRKHTGMKEGGQLCVEEICEEECEHDSDDTEVVEESGDTTEYAGDLEPSPDDDTELVPEEADADSSGEPDNEAGRDLLGTGGTDEQ